MFRSCTPRPFAYIARMNQGLGSTKGSIISSRSLVIILGYTCCELQQLIEKISFTSCCGLVIKLSRVPMRTYLFIPSFHEAHAGSPR